MHKVGFDREKYLTLQGERIEARRRQFGGKLYLEFGGKLVDDIHASRVLPGFTPDNKIVMLAGLADEVEITSSGWCASTPTLLRAMTAPTMNTDKTHKIGRAHV